MRRRLSFGLVFLLAACVNEAPTRLSSCVSATIGPGGGTLGTVGATVTLPPGALRADTSISLCLVAAGRVPNQFSDMFEIAPPFVALGTNVEVTVPVDADAPSNLLAEVRDGPAGPILAVFAAVHTPTSATTTFAINQFGDIRLLADGTPVFDGGGPPDTDRADAPRPVGPVVVGPDLVPADYGCLRIASTPSVGPLMPVTLHITDWADHLPRTGYTFQAAPVSSLTTTDCSAIADCMTGVTDASGNAAMMLHAGPVFVSFQSSPPADPNHTVALSWVVGAALSSGAATLNVPALSSRTQQSLISAMGFGGPMVLGSIRDCDGAAVQRAHVRLFDASGEVLTSPLGAPSPILYGNGSGFPSSTSDRSSIDGVFLALARSTEAGRLEVWGRLTIDTPDVLLGCAAISFLPTGAITLADLPPLAADAPSICGSVP